MDFWHDQRTISSSYPCAPLRVGCSAPTVDGLTLVAMYSLLRSTVPSATRFSEGGGGVGRGGGRRR